VIHLLINQSIIHPIISIHQSYIHPTTSTNTYTIHTHLSFILPETTMTSITLRPRRPLEALPLSRYTVDGLGLPPSPISIPSKRSIHSSPSRQAEASTSKARKVSADEGGVETIRRKRSDMTHEAKAALSRDEFGTGKSPARRLFVDSKTR